MKIQSKAELLSEQTLHGFPSANFEKAGREQLSYLLLAGLNPDSKVLDLGCGVLRAGYWLIHFLNSGCYCGIEPHQKRLEIGIHNILEPAVLEYKQPRFDTNANFNTSVFGEKFDFFLAYSIWTHASKRQIETMLDGFVQDSNGHARFLLTYLPASWRHPDYKGDQWIGTSHESDVAGTIAHSFGWIKAQCRARGLMIRKLGRDRAHRHKWLQLGKIR